MAGELIMGLNAFKTMFDMAKGLQNIHDTAARDRAAIDLQREILAAQAEQFMLLQRVRDLEEEVTSLKAWDAEKEGYELTSIGDGVFAYSKKESMRGTEAPHYLCANCFNHRHKSVLQKEVTDVGRWTVLLCSECKAEIWPDGG